jgi:hypothetical protein
MMLCPLFRAGISGISGNLRVEDEKAGFQFVDVGADALAMLFKKFATFSLCRNTTIPQLRKAEHVPDRHSRRFQASEELDPDKNRSAVVTVTRLVPIRIGQQPDPLVIADSVG